jgi:hypothetical protein
VLVGAEFVHFAHCADQLTQDETTTLETLLNYDQAVDLNTKAQIIVMPRLGTISPWSSKASDILHLCGLEKIKRIVSTCAKGRGSKSSKILCASSIEHNSDSVILSIIKTFKH